MRTYGHAQMHGHTHTDTHRHLNQYRSSLPRHPGVSAVCIPPRPARGAVLLFLKGFSMLLEKPGSGPGPLPVANRCLHGQDYAARGLSRAQPLDHPCPPPHGFDPWRRHLKTLLFPLILKGVQGTENVTISTYFDQSATLSGVVIFESPLLISFVFPLFSNCPKTLQGWPFWRCLILRNEHFVDARAFKVSKRKLFALKPR